MAAKERRLAPPSDTRERSSDCARDGTPTVPDAIARRPGGLRSRVEECAAAAGSERQPSARRCSAARRKTRSMPEASPEGLELRALPGAVTAPLENSNECEERCGTARTNAFVSHKRGGVDDPPTMPRQSDDLVAMRNEFSESLYMNLQVACLGVSKAPPTPILMNTVARWLGVLAR